MDIFTLDDLRTRTGDLIRNVAAGYLSLVTKHGKPIFLAVPFDEELKKEGLKIALAIKLFREGTLNLSKASKLSGESQESLIEKLSFLGISIVRYSVEDLENELKLLDEENYLNNSNNLLEFPDNNTKK